MDKYNNIKDWKVEFIAPKHYAIFHRQVNLEWVDKNTGENPCFETKKEAQQYLEKFLQGENKVDKYGSVIATANDAFYLWEKETYRGDTPLSDNDRIMWTTGYLTALVSLVNNFKNEE